MTDLLLAALLQFSQYVIITVNYRAIACKKVGWAALTDAGAVMASYFIVRNISDSDSLLILAGMVVGGAASAVAGIKFTERWN